MNKIFTITSLIIGLFGTLIIAFENVEPWEKISYIIPGYKDVDIASDKILEKERIDENTPGFSFVVKAIKNRYSHIEEPIISIDDYLEVYAMGGIPAADGVRINYNGRSTFLLTDYIVDSLSDYKHNLLIKWGGPCPIN